MFRRARAATGRRLIVVVTTTMVVVALAVLAGVTVVYQRADVTTVGAVEFTEELPVPSLAESRVGADGTRVFDLAMRAGRTEFRPGRFSETWGFNGDYLGPTLRAARGEKVQVRVHNALPEASTVHWHGMHLPAQMDGGPHQMVEPGADWVPEWTIDQPAATLWYHPHPHGETESHVRRGLAGMFLLDDPAAAALALPQTYGVNDLPIIVQDVKFRGDRLDDAHAMFRDVGFLGDQTMVNGALAPYRTVTDELVRLRLLNASTARTYTFGFSDDRGFALIGTDGGLLERPAELNRIRLSPGERAEIVVRFDPGVPTVLRSYPLEAGLNFWTQRFSGGDDTFDVMQFRPAAALRASPPLPSTLVPQDDPDTAGATERAFDLSFGSINGQAMVMDRIDFAVTRGRTEIWTIRNIDGMPHNFHVHDVQFRVLDVDGSPPPAHLSGPKDTVFLPPGGSVRLALRFDGPADPDTPYMYHCHLLWHEDTGMMGQFVVVEPGGAAGKPPVHGH